MSDDQNRNNILAGNLRETDDVQTSDPLLSILQSTRFSASELKLLATYLSRINSADDSADVVTFTLEEYQKLMHLPNLRPVDMDKYIAGISKRIRVPGECVQFIRGNFRGKRNGVGFINLFRACFMNQDDDGHWVVEMACSEEAKILFFYDAHQIHYVHTALMNLSGLAHTNSCYLYLYLLSQRFRGTWTIGLDELRSKILQGKIRESYKEFKYFNNEVLKKSVAEINEKTDLYCNYTPIKKKRIVFAIEFQVRDNPNRKQKKLSSGKSTASDGIASVSTRDLYEQIELPYVDPDTPTAVMIKEISGDAFTEEDVAKIEEALRRNVPDDMDAALAVRQGLFRDSYAGLMVVEQKGTDVKSRCKYLITIINKNKNSMRSPKGDGAFSEEFVRYWEGYPGRTNDSHWGNKPAAYKRFTEFLHDHPNIDPEEIYEAESIYATECKLNHVPVGKITRPENFLISTSSHPDGKVFEYLDRVMARQEEEAERRARESSPEYQAEQQRIEEFMQNQKTGKQGEKPAESRLSDSDIEKKTEELMNFWKERRSEKNAWTEDSENRLRADISKNIREYGADRVRRALTEETKTKEASELLPRMNLIGTVF